MPEDERKKAIKKQRKAGAKKALADGTNTVVENTFGLSFVAGVDHLEEATKFLTPLVKFRPNDIKTWINACRIYSARGIFY